MISFSTEEIALITLLLSTVSGALTYVFRLLIKEKDRQIQRLELQLDQRLEIKLVVERIGIQVEELHTRTLTPPESRPK